MTNNNVLTFWPFNNKINSKSWWNIDCNYLYNQVYLSKSSAIYESISNYSLILEKYIIFLCYLSFGLAFVWAGLVELLIIVKFGWEDSDLI